MAAKFSHYGRTDQGLVRKTNEDSLLIVPELNLFVVCDGMGGHSAGEVASRTAVGSIAATFNINSPELADDPLLNLDADLPPLADTLVKAVRLANRRVYNRSSIDTNLSGMGTTVAGVIFADKLISIAHVGDSRVYVYRNRKLTPLTEDHSWVAEVQAAGNVSKKTASSLVNKNIITRALGIRESVEVDIRLEEYQVGDVYVLCSDGLCGYSTDSEIEDVVISCKGDPKKSVNNLIRMANERGGSDNVTVICVKVVSCDEKPKYSSRPAVTIENASLATIEREDEWLETLAEHASKRLGKASQSNIDGEDSSSGSSRTPVLFTLLGFLILSAAIYYYLTYLS